MSKSKQPVLSLGAHGTLANSLTYQKRGTGTIVRKMPFPRQPNTLAQWYQRWLYQDYIALWSTLTASQRNAYRTEASRQHMTPFAAYMSESLEDLDDILILWHLDEKAGAIAHDSSRKGNSGVIIGALRVPAIIDYGFWFDGVDDRVSLPVDIITEAELASFSLHLFFTRDREHTDHEYLFSLEGRLELYFDKNSEKLTLYTFDGAGHTCISDNAIPLATPTHACCTFDGSNLGMCLNGLPQASTPASGVPLVDPVSRITTLAAKWNLGAGNFFKGTLDHFAFLSRALPDTDALRHSERRYPL